MEEEVKAKCDITPRQAALLLVEIIYEAIKDAGANGIPSGHLYAMLVGKISLHTYQTVIDALTITGKINNKGHLLTIREVL